MVKVIADHIDGGDVAAITWLALVARSLAARRSELDDVAVSNRFLTTALPNPRVRARR